MPHLMGIDISTTAAKVLIINDTGEVIARASSNLTLSTPQPLWSEQDPQQWWIGVVSSIRAALSQANLDSGAIDAIGMTGQMHGLVLLDEAGQALRPAILWNDQRTGQQCDIMRQRIGKERLIQITGNDALTGFTAPKILWVQQNEPELWARTRHILLPQDYIRFKLTGEYAIDRAGGAGTQLFDLKARTWSPDILEALEIDPRLLPPTFEGTEISGMVSAASAGETGLAVGVPVMGGGGDQAAQAVGVGAVESGILALTVGTSGVVFAPTMTPIVEPQGRLHAFCHAIPDQWHLMGVMLSAAGSLQWHRDTLAPELDFDALVNEAAAVPPGAEGLFFLPYLTGERTPHPDPLARAAWIGLTLRHQRGHMTRAILEGVAFGLKDNFTLMQNAGLGSIRQVRVSGGGAKSPLWRQIMADVLNTELVTVNTSEGAAFGAALLAGVGKGLWLDVPTACRNVISITGSSTPDKVSVARYEACYDVFRQLYPTLAEVFHSLGN